MAKRLYDVLSKCNDEEEVKSEFAKYFKLKLITHKYKIDLYTNSTLFEFKHDRNLSSGKERAKVVAQTLYYVRKLKFGSSTDPVPELICVVDKNEGFFIKTSDFHQFYFELYGEYIENQNIFIDPVVKLIVQNGMMKNNSFLLESPFADQGSIVEIFSDLRMWQDIKQIIETINMNAVA